MITTDHDTRSTFLYKCSLQTSLQSTTLCGISFNYCANTQSFSRIPSDTSTHPSITHTYKHSFQQNIQKYDSLLRCNSIFRKNTYILREPAYKSRHSTHVSHPCIFILPSQTHLFHGALADIYFNFRVFSMHASFAEE